MPRRPTHARLPFARELRRDMTFAEKDLWRAVRGSRLAGLKFRRQVPVGRYVVDFLCNTRSRSNSTDRRTTIRASRRTTRRAMRGCAGKATAFSDFPTISRSAAWTFSSPGSGALPARPPRIHDAPPLARGAGEGSAR